MDATLEHESEIGGHMSFLDHLDELRSRLVKMAIILVVAFAGCWFVSLDIYHFLEIPGRRALTEAQRSKVAVNGKDGQLEVLDISTLKMGDSGRYIFTTPIRYGAAVIPAGTTVMAAVGQDANSAYGLFTTEQLVTDSAVLAPGLRLPVPFEGASPVGGEHAYDYERLIVTTAQETFTLLVTVSLYSAIAVSLPLLLWQIWGFISPALYKHERAYVWPFIGLSSVAFVIGAAFAYYILLPAALKYLLGLGNGEFQLLLRASDYFDLVTIIILAMGLIFQMPAITYVLARIGIVSAGFLIRSWKISLIIILIVAAVASPTGDIPNLLLFASPMVVLYIVSIFIAWIFGRRRLTDAEV